MVISVKDLYAQASCIAAYLRLQDIQPGTPVAVASYNGPFQIMVDIALQFIGAVQIPVPQHSTTESLEEIMNQYAPQVWFVENETLLKQFGELRSLKPRLKEIIIHDEIEHLDYTKLIAFDRVIDFGKTLWRENQQLMNDTRQGVTDRMPMAVPPDSRNKMTLHDLMHESSAIGTKLKQLGIQTLASLVDPYSIPARMASWYGPLLERGTVYLLNHMGEFLTHPNRKSFQALVIHPDILEAHIAASVEEISSSGWLAKRRMHRTLKLQERKYTMLALGNKLPAGLRLSLYLLSQLHYRKVRQSIARGALYLIIDRGRLSAPTEHLLIETGFRLLYIDDIRQ